jgi:hypothetical protein
VIDVHTTLPRCNYQALLALTLCTGCTNDRFVVVGRLHLISSDTSVGHDAQAQATGVQSSADEPDADATSAAQSDTAVSGADAGRDNCIAPDPLHRYSFSGTGTTVDDLGSGAQAELEGGAQLNNQGGLTLDGDDDFAALPSPLLATLTSVTVMLWINYDGGPAYVRLFDFGSGSAGVNPPEGEPSVGRSYLALTPASGNEAPGLTALVATDGAGSEVLAGSEAEIDDEQWHQVTVIVDGTELELRLYLDGTLLSRASIDHAASDIVDENNWLGRSQYDADPYIQVSYDEVRVYADAISDCAVATAFTRGPDAL